MNYLCDRDVFQKIARIGLLPHLPELLASISGDSEVHIAYLPSILSILKRPNKKLKVPERQAEVVAFCNAYPVIPAVTDIARLSFLSENGVDIGEAQLFAIAEESKGWVVTGDKRAIRDYCELRLKAGPSGFVICFEQLILAGTKVLGFERLREFCCNDLDCDATLRILFSNGLASPEEDVREGLLSSISGIRETAPNLLIDYEL